LTSKSRLAVKAMDMDRVSLSPEINDS